MKALLVCVDRVQVLSVIHSPVEMRANIQKIDLYSTHARVMSEFSFAEFFSVYLPPRELHIHILR